MKPINNVMAKLGAVVLISLAIFTYGVDSMGFYNCTCLHF